MEEEPQHLRLTWNLASATRNWETIRNPGSLFLWERCHSPGPSPARRESLFPDYIHLRSGSWRVECGQREQVTVERCRLCSDQDLGDFFERKKKSFFIFWYNLSTISRDFAFLKKLIFTSSDCRWGTRQWSSFSLFWKSLLSLIFQAC